MPGGIRALLRIGGALLSVFSVLLVAGAAQAADRSSQGEIEGLVAAAQDAGLSEKQARHNVEVQRQAGDIVGTLREALGAGFAGVWFNNEAGGFRIGIAPVSDQRAAEKALADIGVAADSALVQVESTWSELEAQKARWVEHAQATVGGPRSIVAVNPVLNAVVVTVADDVPEAEVAALRDEARGESVKVNFRVGPDKLFGARPMACAHPHCDKPLGGGVQILGQSTCTAGFTALSSSDLKPYILTAGHCMGSGNWWTYQSNHVTSRGIGASHSSTYGAAGDQGIIRITDAFWNVAGGYAAKIAAWGTGNGNYLIYGGGWSYYNQYLCRYGRTTGQRCGSNTDPNVINATTYFGVGHQTYNTACASSGDSGGPFVAGNVGYGLTSHSWGCETAGSWYSEVIPAASNRGVFVASSS